MPVPAPEPPPFVGREGLLRRLGELYRAGKHVLLVGQPGAGKSALLAEFSRTHRLLIAPECGSLGALLEALEPQLGLEPGDLKIPRRVHRLAAVLPKAGRPLVLDQVGRVPPKVAHFLRVQLASQPVWVLARSTLPLDIGHLWPLLFLFERIDLPPFSTAEAKEYLSRIPFGGDRIELLAAARRLHRLSAGHPGTLAALAVELRCRAYDLRTLDGLRVLALHARISLVEEQIREP
ncbi:MAG: AAA family ATPase [Opitutaceae bacterium]